MNTWNEMLDDEKNVWIAKNIMGWEIQEYNDVPDLTPQPDWIYQNRIICEVGEWNPAYDISAAMEAEDKIFQLDLHEYYSIQLMVVLDIKPHEQLMLDDVSRLINASAEKRCHAMYRTITQKQKGEDENEM